MRKARTSEHMKPSKDSTNAKVAMLVATIFTTGCVGPLVPVVRIDNESQAQLTGQVRIYRIGENPEGTIARLSGIQVTSCKNLLTDPSPTEQDAFGQLRYRATQLGGNIVLDTICETEGTNLAKNCWSSMTCRGTAARLEKASERTTASGPANQRKTRESSGSGFLIAATGIAVTNQHVVDKCHSIKARNQSFEHTARLLASDESNDLAIIQIDSSTKFETLKLRSTPAKLAEPVAALGFPLPGVLSPSVGASTGTVSSLSGIRGDSRFIQINAPVQPGNSGGPLIDERANVVGVIVGKLNALRVAKVTGDVPQNVNFAIGLRSLQTFLEARGTQYLMSTGTTSSLSEAAEQSTAATIQVICESVD